MIGQPPRTEGESIEKVTLEDKYGKVNFYLLPFVKPSMVKQVVGTDENGNNLSDNKSIISLVFYFLFSYIAESYQTVLLTVCSL